MSKEKKLRLLFPQWQGGDNPPYFLGAKLLNFLAPNQNDIQEEIPVSLDEELYNENGILARGPLLKQFADAKKVLENHNPDQVIILGGDCGVELAPISYMNDKYDGDLAVLWIDAHPDTDNKSNQKEHHAHVLANLLGHGDEEFVSLIPNHLKSENVLLVGLSQWQKTEKDLIDQLGLKSVPPEEIADNSSAVLSWLQSVNMSKVFIHFDLDVLDLMVFRSVLEARPDLYVDTLKNAKSGATFETIIRLLQDVANQHEVIGLGITEHFPWDSYALQNMLARLPLIGDINKTDKPKFNWRF